jgi:NAD(P)-dependent dehydrogenase (short-subunit alcohol dehydrogenase family)
VSGRFARRRALVTGASRGIGAATARRLAAEGADVVVVARTLDHHAHLAGSLEETRAVLERFGGRVGVVVADLADAADRDRIVPEAVELLGGPVEILVNNAALAITEAVTTVSPAQVAAQFAVNVFAPLALAQSVAPGMRAAGEGWIVNLSSAGARLFDGPPFAPNPVGSTMDVYGATKAALNKFTNGLAVELHGMGVRVNSVQPRVAVLSEGLAEKFADRLTPGTIETMEEMVEAVVALCAAPAGCTGRITVSVDLLAEWGITVRDLDGAPRAGIGLP